MSKRPGKKTEGISAAAFVARILLALVLFFFTAFLSPKDSLMGKVWAQSETTVLLMLQAQGYQVTDVWANVHLTEQTAKDASNFAEQAAKFANIISGFAGLKSLWDKSSSAVSDTEKTSTAILSGGQQAITEAEIKLTTALLDGRIQDVQLGEMTRFASDHAIPNPAEQFLCNKIVTCQLAPAMADFARAVSKMVGEGIAMRYRCKNCDGNGPQYAADFAQARFKNDDLKLGSPQDAPTGGFNPEAGRPQGGFYDADIGSAALDRDSVLEVPPMKQETVETVSGETITVNVPNPDPTNNAQMMWMAARQNCIQKAGPRPSPPMGDDLSDPKLISRRAQWDYCVSLQNAFVKICSDRMAKLSRPACADDDEKLGGICFMVRQGCDSAREANVQLPASFQDCRQGANLYQSEYLCTMLCGTSRNAQAAKMTGSGDATLIGDAPLCSLIKSSYEKHMQEEEDTFTRAVNGIKKLNECWAAVDNM